MKHKTGIGRHHKRPYYVASLQESLLQAREYRKVPFLTRPAKRLREKIVVIFNYARTNDINMTLMTFFIYRRHQ